MNLLHHLMFLLKRLFLGDLLPYFRGKRLQRRHFLLLEVMIALMIVIFAVLPLLYPHFYIYKEQKTFVNKLNLDLAINHFKAHIIEKLQRNEIPFQEIEQGTKMTLDFNSIEGVSIKNLPYVGQYYFTILKNKKNANFGLYQFQLNVEILPKENKEKKTPLKYEYLLFAARLFKTEGGGENEAAEAAPVEVPSSATKGGPPS